MNNEDSDAKDVDYTMQVLRDEIQHAQIVRKEQEKEVDPPPAPQFQISHPHNLTNQEMETMKLAA